jgi:hypothetical protein
MKAKKKRGVQAVSYGFAFSFVSAHVLGGGGLVRVGTAAAAATGSSTTLPNKMMAALQTGSASPFLIAEYQQIADVVERGGHLCGLTSCAMSMGQLECFVHSGISYQISPLLVQLLNVSVPSPSPTQKAEVPLLRQAAVCNLRHHHPSMLYGQRQSNIAGLYLQLQFQSLF